MISNTSVFAVVKRMNTKTAIYKFPHVVLLIEHDKFLFVNRQQFYKEWTSIFECLKCSMIKGSSQSFDSVSGIFFPALCSALTGPYPGRSGQYILLDSVYKAVVSLLQKGLKPLAALHC